MKEKLQPRITTQIWVELDLSLRSSPGAHAQRARGVRTLDEIHLSKEQLQQSTRKDYLPLPST